jgi:hypothetical protein
MRQLRTGQDSVCLLETARETATTIEVAEADSMHIHLPSDVDVVLQTRFT